MITVVVLTKNEEQNIKDCLDSIKWCDEIIVIDDKSSDKTVEIAKNLGAKVFKHGLNGDFSMQRNYALQKAKGEWVLFVDADERVTEALRYEIEYVFSSQSSQFLRSQKLSGFYIRRIDFMWEKKLNHGETGNIKILRLARKGIGVWEGKVHETWKIKGNVGRLKNPIYHYPHKTITEFLKEINFYTTIRAKEMFKNKIKVYWWSIIAYPKVKFFTNYLIKLGFLDGLPGFIFAMLMSFHSFIVRGKLWLLWKSRS